MGKDRGQAKRKDDFRVVRFHARAANRPPTGFILPKAARLRERPHIAIAKGRVLSFSTCWNSWRHTSGLELAAEILEMGFTRIELSHGLRAPLLAELLAAKDKLGFEVSSVHAFCPLPPEVLTDSPDCYEFTSHREDERRRAVRLAIATVETALRFGARAVVLHTGSLRTQNASARLRQMIHQGGWGTKKYAAAKLAAVRQREKAGPLYLERAHAALIHVAEAAAKNGISLGIENRENYEAVPSERELPILLDRLGGQPVYAWHDFGHAQIKHHLGLLDHAQYLEALGARVLGAHVHDVKWPFSDHRPPFSGTIAFEKLVPRLSNCRHFVFEMHPRTSREDILAARARWTQLFPE